MLSAVQHMGVTHKMLQQSWHDIVWELPCNSRFLLRPARCWTACSQCHPL